MKTSSKKHITAEDVQNLINDRLREEIGGVKVEEDGEYEDEKEGVKVTLLCVRSSRSHNDLLATTCDTPLIYDHREKTWVYDPVWKKAHALAGRIVTLIKLAYPAASVLQLRRSREYAPEEHAWRIGISTALKRKKKTKVA